MRTWRLPVHQEVELKLLAGPSFVEDALVDRLHAIAEVGAPQRIEQCDTYLDTDAHELRAAGLSARLRRRGAQGSIEVKPVPIDPSLVMKRPELGAAVPPQGDPHVVLVDLLREQLGVRVSGRFATCVELTTVRSLRPVKLGDAQLELCIDRVQVRDRAQVLVGEFCEVEAELVQGPAEAVHRLAATLGAAQGLSASGRSKYQRARDLAGLPPYRYKLPAPVFGAEASLRSVANMVCRHQLATMQAYEAGTRVGLDTEFLHKMRVASRRLRTALRVFRTVWPDDDRHVMAEHLKWIGARLGEVRDLDVHGLDLDCWRRELPGVDAAAWDELRDRLAQRRALAQRRLVDALDDSRCAALREHGAALFAPSEGGHPIGEAAPRLVGRRCKKFARGIERFRRTHGAAEAHQLRILGKRLRYTLEFVAPLLRPAARARREQLGAFQDALGALQDAVAAGGFAQRQLEAGASASLQVLLKELAAWSQSGAARSAATVEAALVDLHDEALTDDLLEGLRTSPERGSELPHGSTT